MISYKKTDIYERINERNKVLEILKEQIQNELETAPEGKLHVVHNSEGKKIKFYNILHKGDKTGQYIKKSEKKTVHELAQKKYNKLVLYVIEKELERFRRISKNQSDDPYIKVYEQLSEIEKSLIKPVIVDDETYLKKWNEQVWDGKEFEEGFPDFFTNQNERVRSKSEIMIANELYQYGVAYRYECPLMLPTLNFSIYPDYTILNLRERKVKYWEHFGLMDNPDYVKKAVAKIKTYSQNGIILGDKLIVSFETSEKPLSTREIKQLIEAFCV